MNEVSLSLHEIVKKLIFNHKNFLWATKTRKHKVITKAINPTHFYFVNLSVLVTSWQN